MSVMVLMVGNIMDKDNFLNFKKIHDELIWLKFYDILDDDCYWYLVEFEEDFVDEDDADE